MAIADPKDYALNKKDETADLRAQLATLAAQVDALTTARVQSGGITADQLESVMSKLITVQADAQKAALREIAEREQQDDLNYPRISAYSYPEGDKARPRPAFKCRMLFAAHVNTQTGAIVGGFDLDWDTTTAAEIELLNKAEPGIYSFLRLSGQPETLSVGGERNGAGVLTKLSFAFPTEENKDTLPSMAQMLRDAYGVKTPEQERIAELERQIAQLATKATVAA